MPYCPKCDMEFVEGITKCTDCGGPLFESKEAAEEMLKKAQAKYNEQMKKQYEMMMAEQQKQEALAKQTAEQAVAQGQAAAPKRQGPSKAFVDKGQKYEDMASSATAFFIVGTIAAVALVLSLAGVINLPFTGVMKLIVTGMLVFMAVGSFAVAISSKKSAAVLKPQISEEKDQTKEIIEWFLDSYKADDIDRRILFTESNLSPEELSLRRFEWIQELLIIGKDLPDQSYVDMLCDEIYSRLFES